MNPPMNTAGIEASGRQKDAESRIRQLVATVRALEATVRELEAKLQVARLENEAMLNRLVQGGK